MQLVCTGALSNAALLLMLFPEVMPMIEVTLMGGCLGVGNTHPVAEFNIVVRAQHAGYCLQRLPFAPPPQVLNCRMLHVPHAPWWHTVS